MDEGSPGLAPGLFFLRGRAPVLLQCVAGGDEEKAHDSRASTRLT
jgi:hypothetical protein